MRQMGDNDLGNVALPGFGHMDTAAPEFMAAIAPQSMIRKPD